MCLEVDSKPWPVVHFLLMLMYFSLHYLIHFLIRSYSHILKVYFSVPGTVTQDSHRDRNKKQPWSYRLSRLVRKMSYPKQKCDILRSTMPRCIHRQGGKVQSPVLVITEKELLKTTGMVIMEWAGSPTYFLDDSCLSSIQAHWITSIFISFHSKMTMRGRVARVGWSIVMHPCNLRNPGKRSQEDDQTSQGYAVRPIVSKKQTTKIQECKTGF